MAYDYNISQTYKRVLTEVLQKLDERDRNRLVGWKLVMSNRMTAAAGYCCYRSRTIKLSVPYFKNGKNAEDLVNTITHELAHAVVGSSCGHGPVWRQMHKHLGGTGARCHRMTRPVAKRKWKRHTVKCKKCGFKHEVTKTKLVRYVITDRLRHIACGGTFEVA